MATLALKALKSVGRFLVAISGVAVVVAGACFGQGIGIEPELEVLENGNVKVSWRTEHDCVAGQVLFGIEFDDDPLGLPNYRVRSAATGSSRSDIAEVSVKGIEEVSRGRTFDGKVFYRATCFDLESKKWLDSGDCVFRYVKRGDSYRRAVAIVEGPIVANITPSSALVRWVTDMPSVGQVIVRASRTPAKTTSVRSNETHASPAGEKRFATEVIVDGLQAGKTYSYHVKSWAGRPTVSPEAKAPSTAGRSDEIFRSRAYRFRTAPPPGSEEAFSFAVFCDTRANDYAPIPIQASNGVNADALRQTSVAIFRKGARFAVIPGDLISGITDDANKAQLQYISWKKAVSPVAPYVPFYTGIGNHDAEIYDTQTLDGKAVRVRKKGAELAEEIFRREMTNPTNAPHLPADSTDPTYSENVYSFDYGSSHFVMLNNDYKAVRGSSDDPEKGKLVGRQLEWLKCDLQSATEQGQKNIFIFFHEPPFPNGGHVDDSMYHNGDKAYVEPRNEFWRVLCRHKVVAVFCGHEHNYSRTLIDEKVHPSFSPSIWQITTGGGGAPFHFQDRTPWSQNVKAFSARQHYCIVTVADQKVRLRAFDLAGNIMDKTELR